MAFSGLALALLLLSLVSRATPCTEQDKSSLLQFLALLSRDGGLAVLWQNSTTDCCSWEGISCNGEGAAVEVVLAKRGLEGHVSPALGDLTGLLRLNLSHNSLSGGLPLDHLMSSSRIVVIDVSFNRLQGELFELQSSVTHRWSLQLQVLNISSNMFTGEFPSGTWKSMKNLVALNASYNSFSGQVPASFCLASASFAMLDLSYNKFTGNIPPKLGSCSMIAVLELGYNRLNGTIPDELFNATSLEHLSLRYDGLHGTLDSAHVAKLNNLITLDLGENHFTGKIPDSIGQLKRLEELHLDSNNMSASSCTEQEKGSLLQFLAGLSQDNGLAASWRSGSNCCKWEGITCGGNGNGAVTEISLALRGLEGRLSPFLGNLTSLQHLNLSYNSFSGDLPSELLSSSSITVLDVSFNHLSRVLQHQQKHNSSVPLQVLNISSNHFTGEFSSILWEKKSDLVALNASNNSFHGWMPSSFCVSSLSFAVLDLCHNQFRGNIPAGLGKCSALKVLRAGHNNLNGTLPDELFNASSLEHLSFEENSLHGILDGARIINLRNLSVLNLEGNNFVGRIPESVGHLKRLEQLRLGDNSMSGELPSTLSNCTKLIAVDLKHNYFSGELTRQSDSTAAI
ncbi:hypothetical protein QOZ80_2BG0155330 [Eleusine coracana subsp. coracana]|nr:hypothetical protein QOZ80_2BG0155330 [Eleusine coracana subsp. coracana]